MLYCDLRNRICVATNSFCVTVVIKTMTGVDRLALNLRRKSATMVSRILRKHDIFVGARFKLRQKSHGINEAETTK